MKAISVIGLGKLGLPMTAYFAHLTFYCMGGEMSHTKRSLLIDVME